MAAADRLREDAPLLNGCRCSSAQKDSDALVSGKKVPIHRVDNVQISSVIQMHAAPLGFYLNLTDLMEEKIRCKREKPSYSSNYAFSYINRSHSYVVYFESSI